MSDLAIVDFVSPSSQAVSRNDLPAEISSNAFESFFSSSGAMFRVFIFWKSRGSFPRISGLSHHFDCPTGFDLHWNWLTLNSKIDSEIEVGLKSSSISSLFWAGPQSGMVSLGQYASAFNFKRPGFYSQTTRKRVLNSRNDWLLI